jgi:hypothetical protein
VPRCQAYDPERLADEVFLLCKPMPNIVNAQTLPIKATLKADIGILSPLPARGARSPDCPPCSHSSR